MSAKKLTDLEEPTNSYARLLLPSWRRVVRNSLIRPQLEPLLERRSSLTKQKIAPEPVAVSETSQPVNQLKQSDQPGRQVSEPVQKQPNYHIHQALHLFSSVSIFLKQFDRAFKYLKRTIITLLVLFCLDISWSMALGWSAKQAFEPYYQLVVYGPSSKCDDGYNCD